ncbi:MAG: hypothetical protein HFACDABA_00088 [Anaerolineales bacterium]|nr:hypothetical protein [Anaerolineales bacterium]
MFNMQAFHQWLSSPTETASDYQRRLIHLTRLGREQLLRASAGLGWEIWHAPDADVTY